MKVRVNAPLTADNVNTAMAANEKSFMRTSEIIPVSVAGAGVFSVAHGLREIPDDFVYSRVANVDVYATLANRATWSDTLCELTGASAGDVRVWFVKRIT